MKIIAALIAILIFILIFSDKLIEKYGSGALIQLYAKGPMDTYLSGDAWKHQWYPWGYGGYYGYPYGRYIGRYPYYRRRFGYPYRYY